MAEAVGFPLPPGVEDVLDGLEAFVRAEILRRHERNADVLEDPRRRYRDDGAIADDVVDLVRQVRTASARAGYFNLATPEAMGGAGLGHVAYVAAWERVYHVCGPAWLAEFAISHWAFGPSVVLSDVSERAKHEVLPAMVAGETMMCFGMSEPDAGSDVAALRTRARAEEGGWRITGRKIWTTYASMAQWMLVFAVTDPDAARRRAGGISAFLVPTGADGIHIERAIRMWGEIGGPEAETVLDDVRVEPWQLVGSLHEGLRLGLRGVSLGRLYNTAKAVGLARWALESAIGYAKDRVAFGQPLWENQGVSFPVAESATEVLAAHLLGLNAAKLLDDGNAAVKEVSMAKGYAVRAGTRAADRAIQVHGAMGFTNECGLVDVYRTLRLARVADGTDEILNRTIAARLGAGDLEL